MYGEPTSLYVAYSERVAWRPSYERGSEWRERVGSGGGVGRRSAEGAEGAQRAAARAVRLHAQQYGRLQRAAEDHRGGARIADAVHVGRHRDAAHDHGDDADL